MVFLPGARCFFRRGLSSSEVARHVAILDRRKMPESQAIKQTPPGKKPDLERLLANPAGNRSTSFFQPVTVQKFASGRTAEFGLNPQRGAKIRPNPRSLSSCHRTNTATTPVFRNLPPLRFLRHTRSVCHTSLTPPSSGPSEHAFPR